MHLSKESLTFSDLCIQRTKMYSKLLRDDHKLYENWLNYLIKFYQDLSVLERYKERVENSTIIALLVESVDCLDGVSILHREGAINATYPLVRKLMELNFQIKFMLQGDTQNKALAFEAYYVSRKTKGKDDNRNIYLTFDKYKAYKEEADKVFNEDAPKVFPEWYGVYDIVEKASCSKKQRQKFISSIKKLCDETGDGEIYDKVYNLISKNVHGIFSRDRIKLHPVLKKNYIDDYRNPVGITFQSKCNNLMIIDIYREFCTHYERKIDFEFINKQFKLIEKIQNHEKEFVKFIQENDAFIKYQNWT